MFYPQFAPTAGHIPDDISIPEWMFANRAKHGLEIAFIDSSTGEKRTWKDVEIKTRQLSRGLAKMFNVKVGEQPVFGLFTPNVCGKHRQYRIRSNEDRLWKCRQPSGPLTCSAAS